MISLFPASQWSVMIIASILQMLVFSKHLCFFFFFFFSLECFCTVFSNRIFSNQLHKWYDNTMGFFKDAMSTTQSRGFPTTSVSQGSPLLLVQTAASTFTNRSREDADRAMGDRAPLPNFGFCNLTLFPALRRREEGTFHQASQWLSPLGAPG